MFARRLVHDIAVFDMGMLFVVNAIKGEFVTASLIHKSQLELLISIMHWSVLCFVFDSMWVLGIIWVLGSLWVFGLYMVCVCWSVNGRCICTGIEGVFAYERCVYRCTVTLES